MRALTRWSIEHPYAVVAVYAALLWLAWVAVTTQIPRRFAPYVESPMLGVVTTMPGLSARDMETYVSKPLEEQLVHVPGLRYIRSSSQDGFSIVTLEFPYGHDMRRARTEVDSQLDVARANMPSAGANLKPSFVIPVDPLNLPILSLAVTGDPARGWTPERVREVADNLGVRRLKSVPDVYSVVVFGGYRRQLQVIVDREKLAGLGLSILDVQKALDRYNVSQSAGTLTDGPNETIVRVEARVLEAEDVREIPVQAVGDRVVFVRDLAEVRDTHWERRSGYHFASSKRGSAS